MWTASALNPAESRSVPGWTPVVRRDSERSASISALNMKAMAMRLRHKVHDVNRRGRTESKESTLSAPGSLSLARPQEADQLMPVEEVRAGSKDSKGRADKKEGPNNIDGLKSIIFHPFSILLIFMPLGGVAFWQEWGSAYCFWLNLLAMVPLAKILGDGTEELAAAIKNDTLSGLLNATLGNVVEMILSIQTLRKGLIPVVKATLLGSILSNILLVLGTSFFFGGIIKGSQVGAFHVIHSEDGQEHQSNCCSLTLEKEQIFSVKAALINVAMQLLACMTCVLPTVFYSSQGEHSEKDQAVILEVSRVGACIIATSYVAYVFFQLITHKNMLAKDEHVYGEDDDDDADEPGLTVFCSLAVMIVSTACIAFCSELLVHSIEEVVEHTSLNQNLIGVVLLPFAGNACEHASAVRFAIQDRPGLSIGIAVGSSTQIALCVVPFAVIMGWILNEPMDLNFGPMNTAVMLLSVLVTQVLVMDGRANWLKGFMLCTAYFFISALYWYFPGEM